MHAAAAARLSAVLTCCTGLAPCPPSLPSSSPLWCATTHTQEIRSRHPDFDMLQFQLALKADAPIVTRAVLTHDLATLKQHCGPELLERFAGRRPALATCPPAATHAHAHMAVHAQVRCPWRTTAGKKTPFPAPLRLTQLPVDTTARCLSLPFLSPFPFPLAPGTHACRYIWPLRA